jgi:hypothetical protein
VGERERGRGEGGRVSEGIEKIDRKKKRGSAYTERKGSARMKR